MIAQQQSAHSAQPPKPLFAFLDATSHRDVDEAERELCAKAEAGQVSGVRVA
jgi:hypothetical protein